ncbi:TolC family protein [candidate division KSB1 bacterium]|nr:TolC family protein [candidate division KSB1 bacterium]
MKRNTNRGLVTALVSRSGLFVLVSAMLMASMPAWAKAAEPAKKLEANFRYKTYSDDEIQAALQRPLTLEDCLGIALSKNLTLKQAEKDFARAQATHSGSWGAYLPLLTMEGLKTNTSEEAPDDSLNLFREQLFRNEARVIAKAQLYIPTGATVVATRDIFRDVRDTRLPLEDVGLTKLEDREFALTITQPLLRGFGPVVANNRIISASNLRNLQDNALHNQKWLVIYQVKRAFYNVLVQRELLKVNEATVASDSALVAASEALVLAKLASRRDVLSAQIRYDEDRAALINGYNDYQSTLDILKDLMGIPLNATISLAESSLEFTQSAVNEEKLVRGAMQNNPQLRSLSYLVREAKLQRSVAKNAILPRLDVYGTYSKVRSSDLIAQKEEARTGVLQAGLSFSYNFLHREAAGQAENAELAMRQQEERLLNAQRQIELSIRDIARSLSNSEKEAAAIKRSIEIAEQKLDFARTMFNLGRASNLDVTDAQEFLLRAKTLYLRKLVSFRIAQALLETLTGETATP